MDPFLHILYFSHSFLLPKKAVLLLLFFQLALSIFLEHNVLTVIKQRQYFHEIYCPCLTFFSMKNKGLIEERGVQYVVISAQLLLSLQLFTLFSTVLMR